MTRLFLFIAFTFSVTHSFGQKENENDFYTFLQKQIKEAVIKKDTVFIFEETKACFGSSWKAFIKPETDYAFVTFYSDKIIGDLTDTLKSPWQTVVDTSFTVSTKQLLENLEDEIKYLKSHLIVSYTTSEYQIKRSDTISHFKLEKGQGLYYWLRFNKSWTTFMKEGPNLYYLTH